MDKRITSVEKYDKAIKELKKDSIKEYNEKLYEKLQKYENFEEKGLLFIAPLKIGDTVYCATRDFISEYKITSIEVTKWGLNYKWVCEKGIYLNTNGFEEKDIGRKVFITKEDAIKKLNSNEDEEDNSF